MANNEELAAVQPGRSVAGAVRWGVTLLHDPLRNKGSAFTEAEREAFGLRGLLPPRVLTQEQQVQRVMGNLRGLSAPIEKYIALNALHDRNEGLYFRVVVEYPDEIMPLIYTPTVGLACQQYGHIFQGPRGMFIASEDRGRIASVLGNWPHRDVGIIVVTDGERVLGLGDLGANGMGIPVGKLALYTACAGVRPERCLPITLDVGTDNESLLVDPLYIGQARRRLRGAEYDAFIEEFVTAVQERFPDAILQFEDFANVNAFRLLATYRERLCCFNDDIQGTAAVALAGLYSALRITGGRLGEQRLLFLGAGEAATGICDLVVSALIAEGMTETDARQRCWLVDSKGLVVRSRADLAEHKRRYAHAHEPLPDLLSAIGALSPAALIGVSATGGAFTAEVLGAMAAENDRPIVFALSNPTSKSECTAEQAWRGTGGRALFASGSPFDPVTIDGRTLVPRQGNNSYVFPGVGLGLIASRARRATDEMFLAAARTLAEQVSSADLEQGSLYPPLASVREVSARIAVRVAEVAFARGLAQAARPADLQEHVRGQMYDPRYRSYV